MKTVLDIDLDFFVTPIKHDGSGNQRIPNDQAHVEEISIAQKYLIEHCKLDFKKIYPGGIFEDHDELFDFVAKIFVEPIHLIHLDAHADIGGGLTRCWEYVFTEYMHLGSDLRRTPKRGSRFLNCGNFIVFLAACGLIERVTFVSHPEWMDDYNCLYLEEFDPANQALQLKRYNKADVDQGLSQGKLLTKIPHQVEKPIPFQQIPRSEFISAKAPDFVTITRSPGYTPASADSLYDTISSIIKLD